VAFTTRRGAGAARAWASSRARAPRPAKEADPSARACRASAIACRAPSRAAQAGSAVASPSGAISRASRSTEGRPRRGSAPMGHPPGHSGRRLDRTSLIHDAPRKQFHRPSPGIGTSRGVQGSGQLARSAARRHVGAGELPGRPPEGPPRGPDPCLEAVRSAPDPWRGSRGEGDGRVRRAMQPGRSGTIGKLAKSSGRSPGSTILEDPRIRTSSRDSHQKSRPAAASKDGRGTRLTPPRLPAAPALPGQPEPARPRRRRSIDSRSYGADRSSRPEGRECRTRS
jgi:hypothetical protein